VATVGSTVKTRVRGHEILPYLEFPLELVEDNIGKLPIGPIILGPRSNLTTYTLGMIHFLKELGYTQFPQVYHSSAPYRA